MKARGGMIAGTIAVVFALGLPAQAQKKATIHESPHKVLTRSCETCHIATSFKDIQFDHAGTGFDLDGPHAEVKCLSCHSIENFTRVEASCVTCHTDVHRGQMGVNCERCHTSNQWTVFDSEEIHSTTNFPLLGRHVMLDCESCHAGMPITRFRQTPSQCIDCHRADYESTQNPSHQANGFSTQCQTCHQMTSWVPATMSDHDQFFPIFSGAHNRVWNTCSDCHVGGGNLKVVSCLGCHEHAQPQMDGIHSGMQQYSYATAACLSCHPTGGAGRYTEHDPQFFPIFSGRHANTWNSCAICHPTATNKKVFTCIECHEHNQQRADDQHRGEANNYTYTATSCYDCHPDGRKGN